MKKTYFVIGAWMILTLFMSSFPVQAQTANTNIKENLLAKKIETPQPGEFTAMVSPKRPAKQFHLVSNFVQNPPVINGIEADSAWENAPSVTLLDYSSQRPITVKSVHTQDRIFMQVQYPDVAPSETHKSLGWDYEEEIYKQLYNQEDVCIIKWSMAGNELNLSLHTPMPHQADVWFWKATRTNPVGYADDKWHLLTETQTQQSSPIKTSTPKLLYLQRFGDEGIPTYKEQFIFDYQGDVIPQYLYQTPTGSRADVQAKGTWKKGYWTIEFSRKLNTGHKDDLVFINGKTYLFGISLYEITGTGVKPEFSQPLYKTGDIYDHVLLTLK